MPRYRLQGLLIRADTDELNIVERYDVFTDMDKSHDLVVEIPPNGNRSIDPSTFGITTVTDLFVFPVGRINVSFDSNTVTVANKFFLVHTAFTGNITLINPDGIAPRQCRLIFGGL